MASIMPYVIMFCDAKKIATVIMEWIVTGMTSGRVTESLGSIVTVRTTA